MNFLPCQLVQNGSGLVVRLEDGITLPCRRNAGALPHARRRGELLFGLRPEHITEARPHMEPGHVPFEVKLDVTEPMGMETMVYFHVNGIEICGRVNPKAGARDGAPMRLAADCNNVHLIDEATGTVL